MQQTGFPPLLLEPIDFGAVYMQQLNAMQSGEAENGGEAAADAEKAEPPAPDDKPQG